MQIIESSQILGQLIKETRKEQNLSQSKLASLSGVGLRFVADLERGKETWECKMQCPGQT